MEFITVTQKDMEFIHTFMQQVSQISARQIYFNRTHLKKANYPAVMLQAAETEMGPDIQFFKEISDIRAYIRDVFGADMLRLFETSEGDVVFTLPHVILFWYHFEQKVDQQPTLESIVPLARGLVLFLTANILRNQWDELYKIAPHDLLSPIPQLDATKFKWRKNNDIFCRYMLTLTVPPRQKAYYFENKYLGHLSYLTHIGYTFAEAKAIVKENQQGLFYKALPLDVEAYILEAILSGQCNEDKMDGLLATSYVQTAEKIKEKYETVDIYNVYTQIVKPLMIISMGNIVKGLLDDMHANGYTNHPSVRFYHLSQHRLGVALEKDTKIEQVFPTFHSRLQLVEPLDLTRFLEGVFC